jgi:hypothetical protein
VALASHVHAHAAGAADAHPTVALAAYAHPIVAGAAYTYPAAADVAYAYARASDDAAHLHQYTAIADADAHGVPTLDAKRNSAPVTDADVYAFANRDRGANIHTFTYPNPGTDPYADGDG